jgi:hypothetical protein
MGSTVTWRLFSTKGNDMLDTLWRLARPVGDDVAFTRSGAARTA